MRKKLYFEKKSNVAILFYFDEKDISYVTARHYLLNRNFKSTCWIKTFFKRLLIRYDFEVDIYQDGTLLKCFSRLNNKCVAS